MIYRNYKDTDMNQDHNEADFIEAIARQFFIDTEAERLYDLYVGQVKARLFDAFDVKPHDAIRQQDFHDPAFEAALKNVAAGLSKQDISDCLTSDVQRVVTTLQVLGRLEGLLPGVLNQLLTLGISNGLHMQKKAVMVATSVETMKRNGLYEKWTKTMDAMNQPKRKDKHSAVVQFVMGVEGVSQAEAVQKVTAQYKKDPDSVARSVRRSNSRRKK